MPDEPQPPNLPSTTVTPYAPDAVSAVAVSMFDPSQPVAFETGQRMARALSATTILPPLFQGNLANCMLLLELRNTMRLPIMEIANGLQLIHGRIGWSSAFMLARIKSSREFRNVRYEWRGAEGNDNRACRMLAEDRDGNTLPGSWISVQMARAEGWYSRTGSKWATLTEQMLTYRAISFWTRANAGHLFSGIPDAEALADAVDITPPARGNGAASPALLEGAPSAAELNARVAAAAAAPLGPPLTNPHEMNPAAAAPAPRPRRGRPPRVETPEAIAADLVANATAAPEPVPPAPPAPAGAEAQPPEPQRRDGEDDSFF